ncbi:hypothetical protein [Microlunatus speluncae]|uniref:hypothetical protein n=1 Tax=Microlunatus speluncae TaxID=2594267 RepID=UPI0012661D1E|nr:hypothetical protein [Microlunatus speluncae]
MAEVVEVLDRQTAALTLCDAHGRSLLTLAITVTGNRKVAERLTVRAIVELSGQPDLCERLELAEQRRELCRAVFHQAAAFRSRTRPDPELPAPVRRLRNVPALNRLAVLLCVFGGHTLRQLADLLELPELDAAHLLRDGLQRI